jgi:DNA-binding MarR family transcriptional regulator
LDRAQAIEQIADNLHMMKREMQSHLLKVYDAINLSPAQVELLKQIRCKGPLSHKQLAAEARLTPGAVTQLIDGLYAAGCIERKQSSDDRRVSYISISQAGERKLDMAMGYYQKLLKTAFDTLTDEELAVYQQAQAKLIDWYKTSHPDPQTSKE